MCGRFVGYRPVEELLDYFPIDVCQVKAAANYNVAPSQEILAIVRKERKNHLLKFHWGLVPFWAKDTTIGARMINARSETVHSKPSFRNAFKKRRCLIVSDGFYEWTGEKGYKQPHFITTPENKPFAFAGIWEHWNKGEEKASVYHSCAIITRAAMGVMQQIHHRMPVILKPEAYQQWLDPDLMDIDILRELMDQMYITDLMSRPVSPRVNTVRNNEPANIEPMQQMELKL